MKITTTETSYQLLFKDARRSSTVYHRFLDALADAKAYSDVAGLVETTCVFYENGECGKTGEAILLYGEIFDSTELEKSAKHLDLKLRFLADTKGCKEVIIAPCGLVVPYGAYGRLLCENYLPRSRK